VVKLKRVRFRQSLLTRMDEKARCDTCGHHFEKGEEAWAKVTHSKHRAKTRYYCIHHAPKPIE